MKKYVYLRKDKYLFFEDGNWFRVKDVEDATLFDSYEEAFKKKLDLILANTKGVKIKEIEVE